MKLLILPQPEAEVVVEAAEAAEVVALQLAAALWAAQALLLQLPLQVELPRVAQQT